MPSMHAIKPSFDQREREKTVAKGLFHKMQILPIQYMYYHHLLFNLSWSEYKKENTKYGRELGRRN